MARERINRPAIASTLSMGVAIKDQRTVSSIYLTEKDEGKRIVTSDGNELGEIMEVRGGIPYVDPDPDILEHMKTKFDVGEPDEDAYPLETADVAEITDNEVYLR